MDNEIHLLDTISDYYDSTVIKELKTKKKEIEKIFQWLIDREAENYKLISENSVHDSVYVQIISRVKKKNSFREKLIRRNLGSRIINKVGLTKENFNSKKVQISNEIEYLDDVIGLRIVCDLNQDCPRALDMISNNLDFLKKHNIEFSTGQIESQPQKMKNGLDIYRIKGIYDDRIGFELQIKSKIDEAWGELDHFIFYKDYNYFPSRTAVQQTMNNVGKLLDKIEDLLYDLRRSKDEYNHNIKNLLFIEQLSAVYSLPIKQLLGFSYQIEKIAPTLKYLMDKYNPQFFKEKKGESNFSMEFLSYECPKDSYNYFRKNSLELKFIEAIFKDIWEEKQKIHLCNKNYLSFLETFRGELIDNILNDINDFEPLHEFDEKTINENIELLKIFQAEENPFISGRLFSEFSKMTRIFLDFISENFESEMEEDLIDDSEIKKLNKIYLICQFKGDLNQFLEMQNENFLYKIILGLKDKFSTARNNDVIENKIYVFSLQILKIVAS